MNNESRNLTWHMVRISRKEANWSEDKWDKWEERSELTRGLAYEGGSTVNPRRKGSDTESVRYCSLV